MSKEVKIRRKERKGKERKGKEKKEERKERKRRRSYQAIQEGGRRNGKKKRVRGRRNGKKKRVRKMEGKRRERMKRKRFKHGICPALPMRKNKKKLKKESCCLRYLYSQSCSLFDNRKKRFIDDEINKIKKRFLFWMMSVQFSVGKCGAKTDQKRQKRILIPFLPPFPSDRRSEKRKKEAVPWEQN